MKKILIIKSWKKTKTIQPVENELANSSVFESSILYLFAKIHLFIVNDFKWYTNKRKNIKFIWWWSFELFIKTYIESSEKDADPKQKKTSSKKSKSANYLF